MLQRESSVGIHLWVKRQVSISDPQPDSQLSFLSTDKFLSILTTLSFTLLHIQGETKPPEAYTAYRTGSKVPFCSFENSLFQETASGARQLTKQTQAGFFQFTNTDVAWFLHQVLAKSINSQDLQF